MKSMTGYGRSEYKDERYEFTVEIKAINHRYKDFFLRIPKNLNSFENNIRKTINSFVGRGRVEVYIQYESLSKSERNIKLDIPLVQGYYNALVKINQELPQINQDIDLSLITSFPEVIRAVEKEDDINELWNCLEIALKNALLQLDRSRLKEGEHLEAELLSRTTKIEERIKTIEKLSPIVEEEYKVHLKKTIESYTQEIEIDEHRLLTEVAIFVDKVSIREEITRLHSHILQFKLTFSEDVIGRKLDFIVQEMNREINTIGSKSNNFSISSEVVEIKSELEKIREQIQNIE